MPAMIQIHMRTYGRWSANGTVEGFSVVFLMTGVPLWAISTT